MKIISGSLKGRKILSDDKKEIRPTIGKIRGAIFSILRHHYDGSLVGKKVIDLCAGTGSLGLEAISLGADLCYFVDSSRESCNYIKYNISNCKVENKTKVLYMDVNKIGKLPDKFDIVFLDPPYRLTDKVVSPTLINLEEKNLLNDDAFIIIESHKQFDLAVPDKFIIINTRTYCNSKIHLVNYNNGGTIND